MVPSLDKLVISLTDFRGCFMQQAVHDPHGESLSEQKNCASFIRFSIRFPR